MKKTKERKQSPQPEMLGRGDHEHGRWQVGDSPATRGIPHTDLHNRKMVAPHGVADLDRVIRAHEMMHAKVSPTPPEMMAWIAREVATTDTIIAVEEARVNHLCTVAGIPVDKYLTDGTEKSSGKKLAESGDTNSLIRSSVACAGTEGGKQFIAGVRSVDKGLAKVLANIQKQVMKTLAAVPSSYLAEVGKDSQLGEGFAHVERIAEWVDRLITELEKEEPPTDEDESEGEDEPKDDSAGTEPPKPGATKKKAPPRPVKDPTDTVRPSRTIAPDWGKLVVKKLAMPNATKGNLGRKRIASDTGKNPRRMHRYFTDRKVFDRTSKGMGGVVLIDGSGSMSFSHNDIREIVEAAPGCTVAMYTFTDNPDNLWILAERGRICNKADMPHERAGNVVDLPALKWAVSKRQRSTAPVIWVSDGAVTGVGDASHEILNRQVRKYTTQNRITQVANVGKAKELLAILRQGGRIPAPGTLLRM